jgi:flagellar hook-basal body complex protein FliE
MGSPIVAIQPIQANFRPIAPIGSLPSVMQTVQTAAPATPVNFSDLLKKTLMNLNQIQVGASHAMDEMATGQAKNIHDVVLSVQEANMSLQFAIQIRNDLLSAYNEIDQMQI